MIYLIVSILLSSAINVIFKLFERWKIHNRIAIIFNYFTCVIVGLLFLSDPIEILEDAGGQAWALHSMGLGLFFIAVFWGMALTAQKLSISASVIAAKMGVIFPVLYGLFYLKEVANSPLLAGIVLSLISVFLMGRVDKDHPIKGTYYAFLPILVFIGSGFIDLNLKIIELKYFDLVEAHLPVTFIFIGAAVSGLVLFSIFGLSSKKSKIELKDVLGGVLLGVPNYFSIYFLLKALHYPGFKTIYVMPLNNIGIVLLSSLLSFLFFKELLRRNNVGGIILAILAILLIGLNS